MAKSRGYTPFGVYLLANKITQAELARRVGVARSTVCSWVNGAHTPDHYTRQRIARLLGVELEDLWGAEKVRVDDPAAVEEWLEELLRKVLRDRESLFLLAKVVQRLF